MTALLASYIPLVSPANALFDVWYLLVIPLAFGISMIWKAVRLPRMAIYWRQVFIMTVQVILFTAVLAVVLVLFVQLALPALPVD